MRIKILKSMAGKHISYKVGQVVDLPQDQCQRLFASGAAVAEIETRAYGSSQPMEQSDATELDTQQDPKPVKRTSHKGRAKKSG